MAKIEPITIPLADEIHPDIKSKLDELDLAQKRQEAEIIHWRGVASDAAAVAVDVRKAMKASGRGARGYVVRNTMAVSGLASMGVGCWWVLPALSLIVVGSIMLGLVVFGTVARNKSEGEHVRSDS